MVWRWRIWMEKWGEVGRRRGVWWDVGGMVERLEEEGGDGVEEGGDEEVGTVDEGVGMTWGGRTWGGEGGEEVRGRGGGGWGGWTSAW